MTADPNAALPRLPRRPGVRGYTVAMCGRFSTTRAREQQRRFGVVDVHETRPLPAMPRFNVAPAQTVPVVVEDAEARRLQPMT